MYIKRKISNNYMFLIISKDFHWKKKKCNFILFFAYIFSMFFNKKIKENICNICIHSDNIFDNCKKINYKNTDHLLFIFGFEFLMFMWKKNFYTK